MRPSWQELHGLVPYIFSRPTRLWPGARPFRIATDWIMSICTDKAGVNVGQSLFTDTDYADDAVLFAETFSDRPFLNHSMQLQTLWASTHPWPKTKIQNVAFGLSPPSCVISGHQVEAVNRFTYLGSDVDSSGYCTPEILRRIGLTSSIMSELDSV